VAVQAAVVALIVELVIQVRQVQVDKVMLAVMVGMVADLVQMETQAVAVEQEQLEVMEHQLLLVQAAQVQIHIQLGYQQQV
jgi:hypothetical protein